MNRKVGTGVVVLMLVVVGLVLGAVGMMKTVAAQAREVPTFQVDPTWPKKLPNNWVFGPVSGVTAAPDGNIWIISRNLEVVNEAQKKGPAAPSVVEIDPAGNFIRGWGQGHQTDDDPGYTWPEDPHGISVDSKGFVWIAGSLRTRDDFILKMTKEGKFVMQIGKKGMNKGNTDQENVHGASDVTYYAPTNEIFVADGYSLRRVIVFDADSGKFKRMWGAFGNVPTDPAKGEKPSVTSDDDPPGPGPQQFSNNIHGVRVSNDGLVYVCDRQNQRVQVFTVDGKYITQFFVSRGKQPESTAMGMFLGKPRKDFESGFRRSNQSASRTAFSADPAQRFLYVLDRRYQKIAIHDRKTLEKVGEFGGGPGDQPGQFNVLHDMAADLKDNFYTAEVNVNSRPQKFTYKGLSSAPSR